MYFKSLSMLVGALMLSACGLNSDEAVSRRGELNNSRLADNGPDFKTDDGIEIMRWVKNKSVQKELCAVVREQKSLGYKPYDPQSTTAVARKFRLHTAEAEIVILYAVEFECPELG